MCTARESHSHSLHPWTMQRNMWAHGGDLGARTGPSLSVRASFMLADGQLLGACWRGVTQPRRFGCNRGLVNPTE